MSDYVSKLLQEGERALSAGNLPQAEQSARRAMEQSPRSADGYDLLGRVAERARNLDAAAACFRQAIALHPGSAAFHTHLGNALRVAGKLAEAIDVYRAALKLDPNDVEAMNNLAIALANTGQKEEAAATWQKMLERDANDASTLANLGNLYRGMGRIAEAIRFSERARALMPNEPGILSNLGFAYEQQGEIYKAIDFYRQALAIAPRPWIYDNLLMTLTFDDRVTPEEVVAEHLKWAELFEAPLASQIQPHENDRSPDRRLRIGYVSPDFREQVNGYHMERILPLHDREHFEIFCYAHTPADAFTPRLRAHADQWRDLVGKSDADAAAQIRADKIDVLIELAGHTGGNRLRILARKPAPVQAHYLGYLATTGMRTVDYRITDAVADPPGMTEHEYTETLVRLPGCCVHYAISDDLPPVVPPPALANGYITFGSFNNLAKVTKFTYVMWADVLKAVPRSRLLLKHRSLGDPVTRDNILGTFKEQGVDAHRIELLEFTRTRREHQQLHGRLDIALDSFPYQGVNTTWDAMCMGVPVISLAGRAHWCRMGCSLVANGGLEFCVANSRDEYVQIAATLAADVDRLTRLRAEMRDQLARSPICDGAGFVRNLEAACRQMWRTWCARAR